MPLSINTLELRDFRNYHEFSLTLSAGVSVIVGPNAHGKTNLVEAIQLVTAAESFRRPRWIEVIREGAPAARVIMEARSEQDVREVGLTITPTRRSYTVNGKNKRPTEILGKLPSVVFTPDDLFMVKGPAEERRRMIDEAGDQLSASYAGLRASYARVLKQRNAALKNAGGSSHTTVLTEQLVEAGARLTAHRARLVSRLAEKAGSFYAGVTPNETLESHFVPSWERYGTTADPHDESDAARAIEEALQSSAAEEAARQTTTAGPHRDDIRFMVGGRDARTYGSQGQQRTVALAWKLAEVGVIEDILGRRPVLLLDDVMSELDRARRDALTDLLSLTTQTIITTTNLQYFDAPILERSLVVELGT